MADKKRFSEDFTHWNDAIPTAFRCMVEDPTTGEEYWVTREQFITGVTIGNMGGASAYDIYKGTTSDIPVLSETDWIDSLYGQDGVTPTIGSNGNWFIGTTDTGVKAQPENPIPQAQIFNAPMGVCIFFVGLLSSLSDSWHLANGDVVEGYGTTFDMRGKVPMGYDPDAFATPTVATGMVKNYGAIGNTGGKSFVELELEHLPAHDHHNAAFNQLLYKDPMGGSTSHQTDITVGEPDILHSASLLSVGSNQAHENRMEYVVGAYIQRVKPEVLSGGSGIESVVAGTNVTIDTTDPKNPIINVSSTETAPYNLSGLDADIEIGPKVSHTMLEAHSFMAADIYLESTAAPTDFAIEVDVKKNGVSIFTTKPKINAGSLHLTVAPVLVTTPTVYAVGDIRTVSVESIGASETGKNLVLSILMHK